MLWMIGLAIWAVLFVGIIKITKQLDILIELQKEKKKFQK